MENECLHLERTGPTLFSVVDDCNAPPQPEQIPIPDRPKVTIPPAAADLEIESE
jgi:hypothetical protein